MKNQASFFPENTIQNQMLMEGGGGGGRAGVVVPEIL